MSETNNQKIEAVVLGTGTSQGVPVIGCDCTVCRSENPKDKRLRSSLLIKSNGQNFIIDAGPDFRQQMLRAEVKSLRAVLVTHEHADHVFGLDDIRSYNWMQKRSMDIYAEERVQGTIRRIFSYVFTEYKYPGIPKMKLHTITGEPLEVDGVVFTPIRCYHHKLPVYGFRVGDLTYITDTNFVPPEEMKKIKGTRILIVNALRREKHISHFNLEEALKMIEEVNPEKAYLTHLSHVFGKHEDVEKDLPGNVFVAYDGLKLELE